MDVNVKNSQTTITYHVRYLIREFNEWWDWRSYDTTGEAIESFKAHKPRVEAAVKWYLIKTTSVETEEVVDQDS